MPAQPGRRPYEITEGTDAIKSIRGHWLTFVGEGDSTENPDEERHANMLNGAVTRLCDNALRNPPGFAKRDSVLPELIERRPSWLKMLREEAEKFLQSRYSLHDCIETAVATITDIDSSIRHIFEQGGVDAKIQLGTLAAAAHNKRERLLQVGTARRHRRQHLHVLAGLMALLSASITAVLTKISPSPAVVQIIPAVIALLSGTLTLITSTYFDEKETADVFEGCGRFLSLRSEADLIRHKRGVTEAQAFRALETLGREYVVLSSKYDHLHAKPRPFNIRSIFRLQKS